MKWEDMDFCFCFVSNIDHGKKRVFCMCRPIANIVGKTSQELLEISGQTNNIPVDLKAILQKLKISCLPLDFSNWEKGSDCILGALVINGDEAVIYYNMKNQVEGHRYRFTIAHEIAHCCLNHYKVEKKGVFLFRTENTYTPDEIAANIFAGELLIPKDSLEKIIDQLVFPSVKALAEIFSVSQSVMLARLKYLNINKNIAGFNY